MGCFNEILNDIWLKYCEITLGFNRQTLYDQILR